MGSERRGSEKERTWGRRGRTCETGQEREEEENGNEEKGGGVTYMEQL